MKGQKLTVARWFSRAVTWSAAVVGIGLVGLAGAYWFSPQIAELGLAAYLGPSANLRLEMGRPTLTSVQVDRVSLSYEGVRVDASAVEAHYSLETLWEGRVSALHVGSISIVSDADATAAEPVAGLPADPWQLMPADRIGIDAFVVEGLPVRVSGDLSADETGVEARLTVDRFDVRCRLDRAGTFDVRAEDAHGSRVDARGTLPGRDGRIVARLEGRIDARSLRAYVDVGNTTGVIEAAADLRGSLPDGPANPIRGLAGTGTFRLSADNADLDVGLDTAGDVVLEGGRLRLGFGRDAGSRVVWSGSAWRIAGHASTDLLDPARNGAVSVDLSGQAFGTPAGMAVRARKRPFWAVVPRRGRMRFAMGC